MLLVVLLALAFLIIRPYLIPVLTSAVLAYIFYPLYDLLNKKIKRPNLSATLISILIILLVLMPISLVLFQISKEANVSYILIKNKFMTGEIFEVDCNDEGFYCMTMNDLRNFMKRPTTRYYLEDGLKKVTVYVAEGAFNFIVSLPKRLLEVFITFFIIFFLLRDGKKFVAAIERAAPLKKNFRAGIFEQLHELTRAIIYGIFVIAVVEGVIAAITFKLFKVASPILWGLVVFILALLPAIGGALIWVPAMIMKYYAGHPWLALGILVGGVIISSIDTFLKPKIIGDRAKVHPTIILLGVLGGLSLFSLIGVIIGPLILVLLITVVKMSRGMK
ncbi:AI-2E family transporter [Candidatus Woesearchaeota archaeon]|nr:AI-2E family transporter [Candidatus Woesearchaeota archaeon]